MRLMSPYELKMKLELADDRGKFVKEYSLSSEMNAIIIDDGSMHFFDEAGEDITDSVESIGYGAFCGCASLNSIIIPDSVNSIEDDAFYGCTSLNSIIIPDSVESIGDYAFGNCKSLTSIIIPDSVKSIRDGAFDDCESLKSIVFKGKTLKEVQSMADYPWRIEDKSVFKAERAA